MSWLKLMSMISTRDLSLLPGINQLKLLSQSLAVLDAIICLEWEYRYYSFNAYWKADAAIASMQNDYGDEYFAVFSPAGAILKGYNHEAPMIPHLSDPPRVWPGVLDDVPAVFAAFLSEPANSIIDTTFCIWRTRDDSSWQRGNIQFPVSTESIGDDPDGSADLLAILDGNPQTYQAWAEEYYEQRVSLAAVQHIYSHRRLTDDVIAELNPGRSMQELAEDVSEIGYAEDSPAA